MKSGKDSGFSLVAVMVGIAVALIMLGAAMPVWHTVVQRDKEEELIFRGEQYVDAIIRFYGKNNRYPLSLEELEDLDGQRYVRKLWTDPMEEDGRWILIFASHNGPPKTGSSQGGVAGGLGAASPGGAAGGANRGGGLTGGAGPGLTAPAGGNDPFGGGRQGNDPFAGGGSTGGGSLGGGRGTSPPDGGGNFPGGGFGGGGSLQGTPGGFGASGGSSLGETRGSAAGGLPTAPAVANPGATFLHGSSSGSGFGQASAFGQWTSADNRQTHQSGGGSSGGGFGGGGWGPGNDPFAGGGSSGGGWGSGGGRSGGGGWDSGSGGGRGSDPFGGGSGGSQSLDDLFGQSDDLFGNRDDVMLNPFEALQGTEEDIVLNARPIIGVRSRNRDSAIREYNGQATYDQWVFKVEQMPQRTGGSGRANAGVGGPGQGQGAAINLGGGGFGGAQSPATGQGGIPPGKGKDAAGGKGGKGAPGGQGGSGAFGGVHQLPSKTPGGG